MNFFRLLYILLNFVWIHLNMFCTSEKTDWILCPAARNCIAWPGHPVCLLERVEWREAGGKVVHCCASYSGICAAAALARVAAALRAEKASCAIHAFQCCSSCSLKLGSLCSAMISSRRFSHSSSDTWFSCRMICAYILLENGSIQKTSSRVSNMPLPNTWSCFVWAPTILQNQITNSGKFWPRYT